MNFKSNVALFWEWFSHNAERIGEHTDIEVADDGVEEIAAALSKVFGNIAFELGMDDNNFQLILSPSGDRDKLYLARFWKEQAPEIHKWTFLYLKPRKGDMSFNIKMCDDNLFISAADFCVKAKPNLRSQKIDIDIYCGKLKKYANKSQYEVVFLVLDACMGEGYSETTIGEINLTKRKKSSMVPLSQLYDAVIKVYKENEWQLFVSPDEAFVSYELKPTNYGEIYRGDIIYGYTNNTRLLDQHMNGQDQSIQYMRTLGAHYLFLAYAHEDISQHEKVRYRGEVEDAVGRMLEKFRIGYVLGGATGIFNSYVDLLIFDLDEFNKCIHNVLEKFRVDIGILPFSILVKKEE